MTTLSGRRAVQSVDQARRAATLRSGVGWLRALAWLRLHGVEHDGFPSFVGRAPLLDNRGTMRLGEHVATRSQQVRPSLATGPSGLLVIGDRTFINQGAVLHAEVLVTIGSRVLIGDYSAVCDTDFHEVDPGTGVRTAAVVIGDDVWLARSVVVLPGSTIGEGTVVATGSVVRGELPPWVVAAGIPARPVRDIITRGARR
jgi:acetyltransferase-like isoleucine patch superfamily enzyme